MLKQELPAAEDSPYSYELPKDRIAQRPVKPYDSAKLLLIKRGAETLSDSVFTHLPLLITAGDLIVFNDTRVLPARLLGKFGETGDPVELLLLHKRSAQEWICIGKPMRRMAKGSVLTFPNGIEAIIQDRVEAPELLPQSRSEAVLVRLSGGGIEDAGTMPIPPYIREGRSDEQDKEDYQPLFAREAGSVASPTASLHFTPRLIEGLKSSGAEIGFVTLHLGPASFLPLQEGERPGRERYLVSDELLNQIEETKKAGKRVWAIGTSVVRALESSAEGRGDETELFIAPGYKMRVVDVLVTNFHQPRTSHLLLVEAFLGRVLLEQTYGHALKHNYRFLSYGDGMVVIP